MWGVVGGLQDCIITAQPMKTNRFSSRTIPLAFLILTILAYGLLLPWLGLYWDDWPFLWNVHQRGPGEVIGIFEHSRPFLWPIAWLTTSLIPATPLAWQVFGLFMRFITGLSVWFCLRTVWPASRRHALTASLLFLVYPAFTQQWIPVTYTNQHFIPFSACLLSLGLSVRAARQPQRFRSDTLLALGLQVIGILPTEYFIGLEILRPLFLWQISGASFRTRLHKARFVLQRWLPYLAVWSANLLWLGYFYQSGGYQYYNPAGLAETQTWRTALSGIQDLAAAILTGGLLGWFNGLKNLWGSPGFILLALTLIAITFLMAKYYQTRIDMEASSDPAWASQAMLIGLAGLLAGRFPSWVAGLPLRFNFGWDRFFLPMAFGASLLLAGTLAFIKPEPRRFGLVSLILALAVGQHVGHARNYQQDWARQRDFFWQLTWRAPGIQPQTVLLSPDLQLAYETDLSLTAPLNWIYASENTSASIPYILLYPELRLGGPKLPQLADAIPLEIAYATTTFIGTTSEVVVLHFPKDGGCLKVLDSTYNNHKSMPGLETAILPAIALSDPGRIIVDGPTPSLPPAIFGPEPAHTWCYYYEKAELARQAGDWPRVASAGRQALNQGLGPQDPTEWLVFIEGYARTNSLSTAEELSRTLWRESPYLKNALCILWRRLAKEADCAPTAERARMEMECKP